MDFEIQIHLRNRSYYFKCLGFILIGAAVILYGALTLPQSIPQQNQLTYYESTTTEQQQTDLRNYQIASLSFKIFLGGIGIMLLGFIVVCKKWRSTNILIERQYRNRQIVPEQIIGNNKTNVKQLKNRPLTIQQQHSPIQQEHSHVQEQPTPIQQQATPIQQEPPIQQQHTPIQQQPLTIQQQPTPIQQEPPIQQQPTPIQQHKVSPLKAPTYRNPYTNPYPTRYYQVSHPVQISYDNYV